MLVLPMLAASFVLSTGYELPRAQELTRVLVGGHLEASRHGREQSTHESSSRDAKEPSRGRQVPLAARKAAEGAELDAEEVATPRRPTRESAYVCPSDMAMIGRNYCVDIYEASLMQVRPDGSEVRWPYFDVLPQGVVVRAVSEPGVFPQGYISGEQAQVACERSGKRLCKPAEWRNACMGPQKTVYPYGNAKEVGRCNDAGRSSMHFFNAALDDKPEHRWMWGFEGNMVDPRLNQLEGTLTKTGERTGCTNAYGLFDMVGNLHEWVDDPDGTFQGGYYLDTHLNGDGCYYRTTAHPVSHLDYSTGFRCCADVADL